MRTVLCLPLPAHVAANFPRHCITSGLLAVSAVKQGSKTSPWFVSHGTALGPGSIPSLFSVPFGIATYEMNFSIFFFLHKKKNENFFYVTRDKPHSHYKPASKMMSHPCKDPPCSKFAIRTTPARPTWRRASVVLLEGGATRHVVHTVRTQLAWSPPCILLERLLQDVEFTLAAANLSARPDWRGGRA